MFRSWHIILLSTLIVLYPPSASTAFEMESIFIASTQTGPRSLSSHLLILPKGNKFFADHYQYSREQIQRLVEAIMYSPIPQLDIKVLGVNQNWLNVNTEPALKEWKQKRQEGKWPKPSEREIIINDAKFLATFKDLDKVSELLQKYYKEKWKGDFAEVKLDISLKGGGKITAHSKSQHLYMIPWVVKHAGKSYKTFNPQISAALMDLLPGIFATNRNRLSEDLAHFIARRLLTPQRN